MAKSFKDFIFSNHKLSDYGNYVSVDLDGGDAERALGLERSIESGESNLYRTEPNFYGAKWSSPLSFELHIIKDPCKYSSQKNLMFSKEELRQITRWLTSPQYPQWIEFEYAPEEIDGDTIFYKGLFNNIEAYSVGGDIYGLKLFFACSTSFGYTDYKNIEIIGANGSVVNQNIDNNNDELNDYCYPQIIITPNSTGQIFICNLSDCNILDSGLRTQNALEEIVENYANSAWCTYRYTGENNSPVYICDENAMQFYLIDKYGNETKCTIFYWSDMDYYYIISNGFMFLKTRADLNVRIDCQKLLIQDAIGRMVTYDELGINDVDHMYWMRLLNGANSILVYGDAKIEFKFRESRKVGE